MSDIEKTEVCSGVFWVSIPRVRLFLLCGCPADAVKHLRKRGWIAAKEEKGRTFETGPNAILLSDVSIQNGQFANLSEFPVLQMLYLQGMIVPDHPGNTGLKPLLIGDREQIDSQMAYIYRGNYGLDSEAEIRSAGVAPKTAAEMMRLKLRFAFGRIRPTEELIDSHVVTAEFSEIRDGIFIRRLRLNVFELRYRSETVTIDLNLESQETYPSPFSLGFHRVRREYFSAVHSGEGDGWDENRPCMASILSFQGKIYLIDAGPNILFILEALGIAVNEIEGIFQSHCHDDHFAGLPALMRADHRIRYFAHPLVRLSVTKKLCALVSMGEEQFGEYFDVVDLRLDRWNDIRSLEVKPVFSPHPVETTVFFFRALSEGGYRSYAHFADIASRQVLRDMITDKADAPGISEAFYRRVRKQYAMKADLKKLDVGGGMIHGSAADFRADRSGRIILAHTSRSLTREERLIGSGTSFGVADTLISTHQDYVRRISFAIVSAYLPALDRDKLDLLLNHPIECYNPRTIILKSGEESRYVYFVLTGDVERIRPDTETTNRLSVGGCFGEALRTGPSVSPDTYRAVNFVHALKIPENIFREAVRKDRRTADMDLVSERREFLQCAPLFGEELSTRLHNDIAGAMSAETAAGGTWSPAEHRAGLWMIRDGTAVLQLDDEPLDELGPGDVIGGSDLLFGIPSLFRLGVETSVSLLHIPSRCLAEIPIVRWKLYENYQKRMRRMVDRQIADGTLFSWRAAYDTGVSDMDDEHRRLFETAHGIYAAVSAGSGGKGLTERFRELQRGMDLHFETEEALMDRYGYPETASHRDRHRIYRWEAGHKGEKQQESSLSREEVTVFFRNWMIHHVLTEDRKLGLYVKDQRTERAPA